MIRFAFLLVLSFTLLISAANAISCSDPGTTPLDPDLVEDLRALNGLNECCCYNNSISIVDHDMEVKNTKKCCDVADDNCTTYWVAILRTAEPYVVDEYINRVDINGNLVCQEVIQNSLDVVCICDGGYSENCVPTAYLPGFPQDKLYYFYCDPCTPNN